MIFRKRSQHAISKNEFNPRKVFGMLSKFTLNTVINNFGKKYADYSNSVFTVQVCKIVVIYAQNTPCAASYTSNR